MTTRVFFFFFLCSTLLGIIVIFFLIRKLDKIWIGSSLGVWESIVNLRMFVWRGLKCFSITLIALFIGDEKQTIRLISVGLVFLINSFCCTLSSWQTIANVCFIFLSPPLFVRFFLRSLFSIFRSVSHQARTFSPTARRSARPWVTPTAAGCRLLCRLMGARGPTTVATCTCPAWMPRFPTLRYLPPSTFPTS